MTRVDVAGDADLHAALADSQRLGFLGTTQAVTAIVEHAGAFTDALTDVTGTVIDLGSGGGVPGLVIARARPDLRVVLVDRRAARADHLVRRLGLAGRVDVLALDAATVARDRTGTADAVVARAFGPPAETLRAASPLLRDGGVVVVSEPPRPDPGRWPAAVLEELALTAVAQPDRRVAVFAHRPTVSGSRPSP